MPGFVLAPFYFGIQADEMRWAADFYQDLFGWKRHDNPIAPANLYRDRNERMER